MEDHRAKMKRLMANLRDAIGDDGMKAVGRSLKRAAHGVSIDTVIKERLAEMSQEGRDLYVWARRQPPGARISIDDGSSVTIFRKQETGWSREGHDDNHRTQDIGIAGMGERWTVSRAGFIAPDPDGDLMEKMGHRTFRKGVALGFWSADGKCNPKSTHQSSMDVGRHL